MNTGSPSLLSNLQVAVREGRSLLVEDIGTSIDPVLDPVLCHRTFMKVWLPRIVSQQIECVQTTCHEHPLPSGVVTYAKIIPVFALAIRLPCWWCFQCWCIRSIHSLCCLVNMLGEPANIKIPMFCCRCVLITREGARCCPLGMSRWNTTPTSAYT